MDLNHCMRIHFSLATTLSILITTITSPSYAQPNDPYISVEDFLTKQKVIRIIANQSNTSNNLTSTTNLITQLRLLGYQGILEIIYNDKKATRAAFNLPHAMTDVYDDVKNKLHFIDAGTFLFQTITNQTTHAALSISNNPWSNTCEEIAKHHLNYIELAVNMLNHTRAVCTNSAKFLNTTVSYRISNWPMPTIKPSDDAYYLYNNDNEVVNPKNNHSYFATPSVGYTDMLDYLTLTPKGRAFAQENPGITYFINRLNTRKFELMTIDGSGVESTPAALSQSTRNLLTIIGGVRYINMSDFPRTKPLIIAAMSNASLIQASLNAIIFNNDMSSVSDKWSPQEINRTSNMIKKLKLFDYVKIADITDPSITTTIDKLQPGQILLLNMGSKKLPQIIFEGIYFYTWPQVWPQIREDANSASHLILTGRPHFRCGKGMSENEGGNETLPSGSKGWEMSFGYLIKDAQLVTDLNDFYSSKGFCSGHDEASKMYPKIGALMQQALDTHSPFSQYFKDIKKEASKTQYNHLYQALGVIAKALKVPKIKISKQPSNIGVH